MKRGMTLIELSFVVVVMGLVVAVTVPAYEPIVRRARAEEVRAMLPAIAHAQLRHHRDRGTFVECATDGLPGATVERSPEGAPPASR